MVPVPARLGSGSIRAPGRSARRRPIVATREDGPGRDGAGHAGGHDPDAICVADRGLTAGPGPAPRSRAAARPSPAAAAVLDRGRAGRFRPAVGGLGGTMHLRELRESPRRPAGKVRALAPRPEGCHGPR